MLALMHLLERSDDFRAMGRALLAMEDGSEVDDFIERGK